jgi:hypothetical protein
MKRRIFLSTCAAGFVACGGSESRQQNNAPNTTAAPARGKERNAAESAETQRIVLRAVGLNAFIEQEETIYVAALNPNGVPIYTSGETLHTHTPKLAIAYEHLADAPGGSTPGEPEVKGWNLRSATKDFRVWPLSQQAFSIGNATGPSLEANVFGAVPLRRLAPLSSIGGWEGRPVVASKLALKYGTVSDDLPRKYTWNTHERFWRFTTGEFEPITDYPVQLTDTLRIDLEATTSTPLTFTVGANLIKTKGTFVEAYLLSLPEMLSTYEAKYWRQLFHSLGGYQLFDPPPASKPIPKTDNGGVGIEPVFCPPLFYSEA